MTHLVFDTNILIDYLSGHLEALSTIDDCANPVISKIVYMEVMVGCEYSALVRAALPEDYERTLASVENMIRAWINSTFKVLPIDEETADLSIEVRKQTKKKLPDTVIHATAMLNGWPIVSCNPRDFTPLAQVPVGYNNVDVILPYSLP